MIFMSAFFEIVASPRSLFRTAERSKATPLHHRFDFFEPSLLEPVEVYHFPPADVMGWVDGTRDCAPDNAVSLEVQMFNEARRPPCG
jgi:hypothetical protein